MSSSLDSGIAAPAIAADGTIYACGDSGTVNALNPDGSIAWSYPTGEFGLTSPAIGQDGTIYVSGLGGHVIAINSNGSLAWNYPTGNFSMSAPVVAPDGRIYLGSGNGTVYAFAKTGFISWSYPTGDRRLSSCAISPSGSLYVTGNNGGLYALTTNGLYQWDYQSGEPFLEAPSIGPDGTIYFGGPASGLYSVDTSGNLNWNCKTGNSNYLSIPAIATDGTIYVFGGNGALYAVDPDGTLKWHYQTNDKPIDVVTPIACPAIGSDGTIYVAGVYGNLYSLAPNGDFLWSYHTGTEHLTSPAIGSVGELYFGCSASSCISVGSEVNTVPATAVSSNPNAVVGGTSSTGTVSLSVNAPAGGDIVTLLSGDPAVTVPPFVFVPGGTSSAQFTIDTSPVPTNTSVIITASSGGVNVTTSLLVQIPTIDSISITPSSVFGGLSTTGTATLNGVVAGAGIVVNLSSADTSLATVPATVTVPAGSNSATFTINAQPVATSQSVTISGTQNGATQNASLTVNPANLTKVSTSPVLITGGNTPNGGTVTVATPAPVGGGVVQLSTSSSSVQIPATVTIQSGATSANFAITTSGVDVTTPVTITATYGTSVKTCVLTLIPAKAYSITVSPTSVTGGSSTVVTGTVSINGRAGPSGVVATLLSSDPTSAIVPTNVTIPAGAYKATFAITTKQVASTQFVTISATATVTVTTTLTVNPGQLASVTIAPAAIVGGNVPTGGIVTLISPAPAGGTVVTLNSNSTCLVIPANVTVAAGATTATFAATTNGVDASTTATITATVAGQSKTCAILVLPAWIWQVTLSPTAVVGGSSTVVTGTVSLIGLAGPSGTVVNLSSSDTGLATVPASVTVPAGAKKATFTVTTFSVASTQAVTITGSALAHTATANLTLNPVALAAVSISTNAIVGGNSPAGGTVTLNGPAPAGGLTVNLSSSNPAVIVPATATVAAGATTGSFAVATAGVDSSIAVTVTATLGTTNKTCVLTIMPATILSITLNASTVTGGTSVTATVHLNGRAGPSGVVVNIASDTPLVAAVPGPTITVSASSYTKAFVVKTFAVGSSTPVTLTASMGAKSASVILTVTP